MIKDFIASKDVRHYLQEQNYQFTDFEQATLIYNSARTISEMHRALQELRDSTEDRELFRQIQERIDRDNTCLDRLQNQAEDCIYRLEVWENEDRVYEPAGYFKDFAKANQYACGSGRKYNITATKLECATEWNEDSWGDTDMGAISYNEGGEAVSYWISEDEESFKENGTQRFEDAYMWVPHPFVPRDIVRIVGTDAIGLVRFCGAPSEEFAKAHHVDYIDTYITLEILQESAVFVHEHVSPLMIEYANLQENDDRMELLESAGYLIAGKGYIETFQRACKNYKKSCEERPQR